MKRGYKKKQLFDSLDEVSIEMIYSNLELSKEILKEEGFDIDKIEGSGEKFIKKLKFLNQANKNLSKNDSLFEKALHLLQKQIEANASLAGQVLMSHLKKVNPAVQYRNLEKWSEEEIREVLNETDIINLIEDLDEPESI